MRVVYDSTSDILTVIFSEERSAECDDNRKGISLDYDADGALVQIEIRDASKRVDEPARITFEVAGEMVPARR